MRLWRRHSSYIEVHKRIIRKQKRKSCSITFDNAIKMAGAQRSDVNEIKREINVRKRSKWQKMNEKEYFV